MSFPSLLSLPSNSFTKDGGTVELRMTIAPCERDSAAPLVPKRRLSTCIAFWTIRNTTSAPLTASAADSALSALPSLDRNLSMAGP